MSGRHRETMLLDRLKRVTLLEAVKAMCYDLYRIRSLGPTSLVKGQAFSYLQQSLRLDGWRGMTHANIVKLVENNITVLGFERGRGRRNVRNGNRAWGSDCEVVFVRASLSQCTDEQLKREEADERANRRF